jgi:hypothetical protein
MIKNYSETTPLRHKLFPVSGRQIELSFTGDQISSDGGLLLLREVENRLDFIILSNCLSVSLRYKTNVEQQKNAQSI